MSKELMERARARMKKMIENEVREIRVPELGESEEEPLVIYVYPLTTQEYQNMVQFPEEADRCIRTLIERARNEKGEKLYSTVEAKELKKWIDLDLLMRLTREINEDLPDILAVDAEETAGK